jgi:hypothetical protein
MGKVGVTEYCLGYVTSERLLPEIILKWLSGVLSLTGGACLQRTAEIHNFIAYVKF